MRTILLALMMTCAAGASQAAVMYNWTSTGGWDFGGRLEITDEAYANGRIAFDIEYYYGDPGCDVGVDCDDFAGFRSIEFSAAGGGTYYTLYNNPDNNSTALRMDITILPSDLLSGSIIAQNTAAGFNMSGDGAAWSVDFSNENGICYQQECLGTGYWQRVSGPSSPPHSVPEPFSAVLLGAGLTALAVKRRRR